MIQSVAVKYDWEMMVTMTMMRIENFSFLWHEQRVRLRLAFGEKV